MLLSLPAELIHTIAHYSDAKTQGILSRVSSACWLNVSPVIWREVWGVEHILWLLVDGDYPRSNPCSFEYLLAPDVVGPPI
jgi:hypothetical protein